MKMCGRQGGKSAGREKTFIFSYFKLRLHRSVTNVNVPFVFFFCHRLSLTEQKIPFQDNFMRIPKGILDNHYRLERNAIQLHVVCCFSCCIFVVVFLCLLLLLVVLLVLLLGNSDIAIQLHVVCCFSSWCEKVRLRIKSGRAGNLGWNNN